MRDKVPALALAVLLGTWLAAYALTVDEIVEKNIQAHGGMETYKATKTMRIVALSATADGSASMTILMKRPDLIRIETTMQDIKEIRAFDGQLGWSLLSLGGDTSIQEMSQEDKTAIMEAADFDGPLVDYKSKGNTVELIGKEIVNGTDTYKIRLTLGDGNVSYLNLDSNTFLDLRETRHSKRGSHEVDSETLYSDYKSMDGLTLPFTIEARIHGQTSQRVTIKTVERNVSVDDSVFQMPPGSQSQPSQ